VGLGGKVSKLHHGMLTLSANMKGSGIRNPIKMINVKMLDLSSVKSAVNVRLHDTQMVSQFNCHKQAINDLSFMFLWVMPTNTISYNHYQKFHSDSYIIFIISNILHKYLSLNQKSYCLLLCNFSAFK